MKTKTIKAALLCLVLCVGLLVSGCTVRSYESGNATEEEVQTYVDANREELLGFFSQDSTFNLDLTVEGNVIVYTVSYTGQLSYSNEEAASRLDTTMENREKYINNTIDDIEDVVGKRVKMRFVYKTVDGETISSYQYPN